MSDMRHEDGCHVNEPERTYRPRLTGHGSRGTWLWLWLPMRRRDLAAEINTCIRMSAQSRSPIHCAIGFKSAVLQTKKKTSLQDDFALHGMHVVYV